ncbi:MAG: sensor histidine kinase [Vagococcus sp.]
MWQFLLRYLKDHKSLYSVYAFLCVLLGFTFYLHALEFAPLYDALLFTSFILLMWTIVDARKTYLAHQKLVLLLNQEQIDNQTYQHLDIGTTLLNQDYQQLVKKISKDNQALSHELMTEQQKLIDYYGMWSHQIKTPLAALQVLIDTQPNETSYMKNEIATIDGYLSMMLHYLKMTNIEEDLVLKTVDIYQVVKQIIRKYALFFIQKDLRVDMTPFTKYVVTDEKWLSFILEQLIFNSIKYTNSGVITIYLKEDALVIQDTGIGILAQDLPRIFESGYTGFNGRENKKATGLGLHMSQEIAKTLGVTIGIESELSVGTTVTLTFEQVHLMFD